MFTRSGIFWLAPSTAEIGRAREVLSALRPSGVLDELGFLVLAGAFADRFYPATNTVMTRARYLVFVPAIYRYLEETRKAVGKDAERIARDVQDNLRKVLQEGNERGIIGRDAGRDVVRLPANIYWSALADLGIATQRISESTYQDRLSEGSVGRRVIRDDDNAIHPDESESLWDPTVRLSHVLPAGVFPASTRLVLSKSEATLLRSRYDQVRPDGHVSMLTHLIRLGVRSGIEILDAVGFPWDAPNLPDQLDRIVDHARRLSLFARGVTLQYHRMLIEKRKESDPGAEGAFAEWFDFAQIELSRWPVDEFFALVRAWGAERLRLHDREFFRQWIDRCTALRSATDLLNDREARLIVERRESHARPGKQRLRDKRHLQSWTTPARGYPTDEYYQLDFRHAVGRRFARDIVEGLQRGTT